jgi:glycine hydroxymethyltransferase
MINGLSMNELLTRLHDLGDRQLAYERSVINLIASDNAFPRLQEFPGYRGHMIQEGLLGRRPFAGATLHDELESFAEKIACAVFGAEHANLQPHSCSQANQAVYQALLSPGDTVMALGFRSGGHITHGLKANFSGRLYRFVFYESDDRGFIDYSRARDLAKSERPKLIVCGSSSYPRLFDAQQLRSIADAVGARLMFDLSHEAGLIAGQAIANPVPLADAATMSLDKTLRGPFGGMILCRSEISGVIDRGIHPGTQSSFPIRKLADAAQALALTRSKWFRRYAQTVLENAKTLEQCFSTYGAAMVTGGTDKHYLVLDVKSSFGLSGFEAEQRLEAIGILASRQTLPSDDSNRSLNAGGLRLGTAWVTSRGYRQTDLCEIAEVITSALSSNLDQQAKELLRKVTNELAEKERTGDVWGGCSSERTSYQQLMSLEPESF